MWLFLWPSPALESSGANDIEWQYTVSCLVYTASAILELATEPLWLICQLGLLVRPRIALEAVANISRAAVIVIAVYWGPRETYGLYLLACPQVSF